MKKRVALWHNAMAFAMVLFAATAVMAACGKQGTEPRPQPQPQLPAAAGTIAGATELTEGSTIELTIAEIANATSYKWYKDGAETQNTASRTLTVTAAGTYKVAGVNDAGEGTASADHVVTLKTDGGYGPEGGAGGSVEPGGEVNW